MLGVSSWLGVGGGGGGAATAGGGEGDAATKGGGDAKLSTDQDEQVCLEGKAGEGRRT